MEKVSKSNQFCLDILQLEVRNVKALANTVMSMASTCSAHSPVELSGSPLFHYQNTSVSKSVANLSKTAEGLECVRTDVQCLCNLHLSKQMLEQKVLCLQTDTTPACHAHSPTLEDRTYVYIPNNAIPGNKPLGIGYRVSSVNVGEASSNWSLPLDLRRVKPEQTAIECAVQQINGLFVPTDILPLKDGQLVLNNSDTGYAHPSYVSPLHRHEALINNVRLRAGSKVWEAAPKKDTGGAPRIYAPQPLYLRIATQLNTCRRKGKTYVKLQPALCELPPDDDIELEHSTQTVRLLIIRLRRWNDKMWRTKQGNNMHDKPLDILCTEVRDALSGKPVFEQPVFTGIVGRHKAQISTQLAFESYRSRYNIEPAFRFEKQDLMLQTYQPPNVRHFDNWLLVVMLSFWLLFSASDEVEHVPKKWQQYPLGSAEHKRQQTKRWSPAQTKKGAQRLFLTFDPTPFLPQNCKKGKGRQKGQIQTPRPRFKVLKKQSILTKKQLKTEILQ